MPGWRGPKRGKGVKREAGMNKLEAAYSLELDRKYAAGEIQWRSQHEAIKLKLADLTFFTPDFLVMNADGEMEVHECKGGLYPEHNRVKTKVAAQIFPLRFILVRKPRKDSPWEYEEV